MQSLDFSPIGELVHGAILGTVVLASSEPVTQELVNGMTRREWAFGFYEIGRWAWRLEDPIMFATPIVARGNLGFWEHPLDG